MKAGDIITLRQTPDGRYIDNFLYIYGKCGPIWEDNGKLFPGEIALVVDPQADRDGMILIFAKEKIGWVDVGYIQAFVENYVE